MRSLFLVSLTFTAIGCSGGLEEFPTAKVTGKVLCNGQPVPNVQVVFGPTGNSKGSESGKSGLGVAGEDGSFVVSTYGSEDGAVVGMHNIMVLAPHPEEFPTFNCDCETDGRKVVQTADIKAGTDNTVIVNLPPKVNKQESNVDPEDLEDIKAADATAAGK